jgi:hypothetical protein
MKTLPVGGAFQLKALLAPYPSDEMICWPVSARVGNVKNNDPSLIEPIAAAGITAASFDPNRVALRTRNGARPDRAPLASLCARRNRRVSRPYGGRSSPQFRPRRPRCRHAPLSLLPGALRVYVASAVVVLLGAAPPPSRSRTRSGTVFAAASVCAHQCGPRRVLTRGPKGRTD